MLFLRFIFKAYLRLKYERKYNVTIKNQSVLDQVSNPVIFISNHPSLKDTVFYKLYLAKEFYICGAQEKYFSTARKRFKMKLGKITKVTTLEEFMSDCSRLIQSNHLLIYPQMSRNKEITGFKDWCARVAIANDATVIPMRIRGTEEGASPGREIEISIGEAIQIGEDTPSRLTARFLDTINTL